MSDMYKSILISEEKKYDFTENRVMESKHYLASNGLFKLYFITIYGKTEIYINETKLLSSPYEDLNVFHSNILLNAYLNLREKLSDEDIGHMIFTGKLIGIEN